ncbi:MAG: NAD(P)/FAD-dependent oxidoreductase [Bacteroidia bacterium]|jgi:putative flavoprotein involved in K+ transport|nr:NAD(P)/FAD-dependent oxidoreductase [Bacteroidia bacterium]
MTNYNTVIIGAGQAGLSAAYYLNKQRKKYVVLEAAGEIGASWANRYDSLSLFTSARYNNLPGAAFPGDKDRFPTKNEVVDYLNKYVATFNIQVLLNNRVTHLSKSDTDFMVITTTGSFYAKNVIVCTGPFQIPFVPTFSQHLNSNILQLHSNAYKKPAQLRSGDTLVVGGGNSGVQIVEELINHGVKVFFSFSGELKGVPNNILMQRLIFGSGITSASINSLIGKWLKQRKEPIMGTNLKKLFNAPNLTVVGKALSATDQEIICEKSTINTVQNIIWATGFKPDFGWIALDVLDATGFPLQERGLTKIKGLFFLGLAWMYSRNSGLLGGVGKDAKYVTNNLAE